MFSKDRGSPMKRRTDVAALPWRIRHRHRGQTLLLVSIAIAMLVGIAAVAVDVGNPWTTRRLMQSAADAGAVAGADEIAIGGSSSDITTAAKDASSHNGFADGGTRPGTSNTITVAVHNPPTSGSFASNSNAVEVDVSENEPTYFMRVFGWRSVPVSTTATAVTLGSGSCIYALDPSASGAIDVGGSAGVSSACGLYDNSTSSSALIVSGGGTITAPLVGVAGGTTVNGGGSTPPSTGIAQFGGPLAYIAEPTVPSGKCSSYHTQNISGSITAPQTYCGGIHINAGNAVTFGSDPYIIDGGGITTVAPRSADLA